MKKNKYLLKMLHRIHRFRFDIVNDRYENIYEKKKRVYEYLHFLFDFINEYVNERLIRIGFNLTKGVACIYKLPLISKFHPVHIGKKNCVSVELYKTLTRPGNEWKYKKGLSRNNNLLNFYGFYETVFSI